MSVCIDASLIIKCLVSEPGSDKAISWLKSHKGEELVAPPFLAAEVASVLRRKVRRREITSDDGREVLGFLRRLGIRSVWEPDIIERAFDFACDLDEPGTYDTIYLAVAELERCDLWTADARFVRAAAPKYPYVRLLD